MFGEKPMPADGEVLLAIMNSPLDFSIAQDRHWYRVPVSSAKKWLKGRWPPQWLVFYQTQRRRDRAGPDAGVFEVTSGERWQQGTAKRKHSYETG